MNDGGHALQARGATRAALAAFVALALGACNDVIVPDAPRMTGSQGGRLPGMSSPASGNTTSRIKQPAEPFIQEQHRVLPDGTIRTLTTMGGLPHHETVRNRAGDVERIIWYGDGAWVRSVEEFGPGGVRVRETVFMPASQQVERIAEFTPDGNVAGFRTYWPNGQLRIYSSDNVETAYGTLYQVQEWWPNGKPRRLDQYEHLPTREFKPRRHGRQAEWDETGRLVYDAEYNHGRFVRDYVKPPPEDG